MNNISQEYIRERYDYHPDGYLIARERLSPRCGAGDRVGSINERGYIITKIKGERWRVHRLIYIYHYGEIVHQIDHINNDRTDNRIENLRDISQSENQLNRLDSKVNGVIHFYTTSDGIRRRTEAGLKHLREQRRIK